MNNSTNYMSGALFSIGLHTVLVAGLLLPLKSGERNHVPSRYARMSRSLHSHDSGRACASVKHEALMEWRGENMTE